jgi:Rieske Fe-S protein
MSLMNSQPGSDGQCAGCSRRSFLASASVLSIGALATACGDGIISEPDLRPEFPSTPFTINPNQVAGLQQVGGRVVVTSGVESPVLVERLGGRQFRALSLICPHKGTIVDVQSGGFLCPNHGARFANDGTWQGGQATADLAPLNVLLNADGSITVGGTPTPPTLAIATNSVLFSTSLIGGAIAPQTVAVTNAGGSILSGLTVALAYGANQRSGWLAVALDQTSAPATLTLTASRGIIPAGTYTATVTVSAPGITNSAQQLAVTMVVQDVASPASIQLSAASLSFAAAVGNPPASQTVQITNGGGGTIAGLATAVNYGNGPTNWLVLTLGQTAAPTALTLRPVISNLLPGTYTATVTVSATGMPSRTIAVSISVTAAGLLVNLASWPALANVGGVAGSVGNVNGGPVAVARTSQTSFLAFSMRCPHAGTTINVVNGTSFRCPNHGAQFDNQGIWQQSPQRAENLQRLTVTFTPGASTLTVS